MVRIADFQSADAGSIPVRTTKMVVLSNWLAHLAVNQTSSELGGSNPSTTSTCPCRLRWLGHHPFKVKEADRHRSGMQKLMLEYANG